MADPKVQEIEQRLQAATPGPWAWGRTGEKCTGAAVGARCFAEEDAECASPLSGDLTDRPDDFSVSEPVAFLEHQNANADASLIAHAPGDLRYLLDRLAALEAQRDALQGMVSRAEAKSWEWCQRATRAEAELEEAERLVTQMSEDAARSSASPTEVSEPWHCPACGSLVRGVHNPRHYGRCRLAEIDQGDPCFEHLAEPASPTEKLDELAAESQRLGLYDPQPGGPDGA
jgi:hypothetical protein